ncbi:MAG: caspase family protein [Hyphomonas sp.]
MRDWGLFLGWILVCLCGAGTANADGMSLRCQGDGARIALVVTNSEYSGRLSPLPSTEADSRIMGDALCRLNFTVREVRNADLVTMRGAIGTFVHDLASAPEGAIGFFYYSGHGAQSRLIGESYLIPANAPISLRAELPLQAIGLGEIVPAIRAAALNKAAFIVLDACRDVAFPGETMGDGEKGILRVPQTPGVVIAYSTSPGETAIANNAYSTALAKWLGEPGLKHDEVFKGVRRDVYSQPPPPSGQKQFPWWEDGILGEVVLNAAPRTITANPCADPGQLLSNALGTKSESALQVVVDACAGKPEAEIARASIATLRAASLPPGPVLSAAGQDMASRSKPVLVREITLTTPDQDGFVTTPELTASGQLYASHDIGYYPRLFDIASGRMVADLRRDDSIVTSHVFSPDGSRLVIGYYSGLVKMIDTASGTTIVELPDFREHLSRFTYSDDGTRLVTDSSKGPARLWDGRTGRLIADLFPADGFNVTSAAFSLDGKLVATMDCQNYSVHQIWLWYAETGTPAGTLALPATANACAAAFSADGTKLVAAGQGEAWIWYIESRFLASTLRLDSETISSRIELSESRDTIMLKGAYDKITKFFRFSDGKFISSAGRQSNYALWYSDLSHDGQHYVEANVDGTIQLYDVAKGTTVATLPGGSSGLAFSPDSRLFATAGEDIEIREAATGALVWRITNPSDDSLLNVAFSADSRMIAAGTYDGTVRVWRLQ